MAGISGAVEDGVRGLGIVISLVVAVIVGWLTHSYGWGLGMFVAGYAVSLIWGQMAGDAHRARYLDAPGSPRPEDSSEQDR